ncbi:LOW QUALITY PROTEIN: hypothetical protein ACHAWF_005696 [Thalassiosira exigua]
MSGVGSPRYMAPECLIRIEYNLKAGVYTFAVEILTWKLPFNFARSKNQLISYVVEECGRPEIKESWPFLIQSMMESSFSADAGQRPVSLGELLKITNICVQLNPSPLSFYLNRK